MKNKTPGRYIEVRTPDEAHTQLVNIDKVTNMRSTIDDRSNKRVTFIYFDGPGSYCRTPDTIEEVKRKIIEESF